MKNYAQKKYYKDFIKMTIEKKKVTKVYLKHVPPI